MRVYQRDLWQVDVSLGGESILTISHNHLGGLENITDYAEIVEKCADHLFSFIGKRHRMMDLLAERNAEISRLRLALDEVTAELGRLSLTAGGG